MPSYSDFYVASRRDLPGLEGDTVAGVTPVMLLLPCPEAVAAGAGEMPLVVGDRRGARPSLEAAFASVPVHPVAAHLMTNRRSTGVRVVGVAHVLGSGDRNVDDGVAHEHLALGNEGDMPGDFLEAQVPAVLADQQERGPKSSHLAGRAHDQIGDLLLDRTRVLVPFTDVLPDRRDHAADAGAVGDGLLLLVVANGFGGRAQQQGGPRPFVAFPAAPDQLVLVRRVEPVVPDTGARAVYFVTGNDGPDMVSDDQEP